MRRPPSRPGDGLVDADRPGAPKKTTDKQVEQVVAATLGAHTWPNSGSGELTTNLLQRGAHKSVQALQADSDNPHRYVSTKTANKIPNSIAALSTNFRRGTLG